MEIYIKRAIKLTIFFLLICLILGTGLFIYDAKHSYDINEGFTSLPLNFNPDDSTSSYNWNGIDIIVHDGFIKGIQESSAGEILVIRALSPLPDIEVINSDTSLQNISIDIENINPELYDSSTDPDLNPSKITVNTLEFSLSINAGETIWINPSQPGETEDDNYVILGDSRDGYETFAEIIAQVNELNPAFVIDNGDLVYSGKPNQYRIFNQMVSGLSCTLCTTLGNHDIRANGRNIYTKLYGPEYYSFDYGDNHFIFLDSSPGYAEMQAISEEQYTWLEKDLQKAQGKRIFVISHIPPTDPRSGIQPNDMVAYTDKNELKDSYVEQKLETYIENEAIDHGFQDEQEAQRFEALMSQYGVTAVYLSHIHSYFDFEKDGVRYVISGGAGAELLTENSYYHYLIAKAGANDTLTMVQLTTPSNLLLQRYGATIVIFAQAIYKENQAAVILLITGFVLLVLLTVMLLILRLKDRLAVLLILMKDTGKFMVQKYKELKNQNK